MKLPKYVIIENKQELPMPFVLQTDRPQLIGRPIFFDEKRISIAEEMMMSIVNGQRVGVKIPGYRGFMMASGSLTSQYTGEKDEVVATLREMAEFYIEEKIKTHEYSYRKNKED